MTHRFMAAAGLCVAVGCLSTLHAQVLEQVLVRVNGEIVSKTEFEDRQLAMLRNRPELANATPASLELQRAIAEILLQSKV